MSEHAYAQAGGTFSTLTSGAPPGLLGAIGYRIESFGGAELVAHTTDGIVETPTGPTSIYTAAAAPVPADAPAGDYLIVWSDGAGTYAEEPDVLTINYFGQPPAVVAGNDAIANLAELRREEPLDDDVKYPDDLVLACRDALIEALEHECRTAFVRRTRTDPFDDSVPMATLALGFGTATSRHPGPTITAVTVNGAAVDLAVTPVTVGRGGHVRRSYGAFGRSAELTYEYGYEQPPGRVKRAVRIGTAAWLAQELDSPVPDRATSWTTEGGTFAIVTAGVRGAMFDVPELNAIVQAYGE